MMYTINNIADFCDVDYGFICRIIDGNELRPSAIYGNGNEKKGYSFYQLFIIQQILEQLAQKEIFFDFENEEVYSIYQSNLEWL